MMGSVETPSPWRRAVAAAAVSALGLAGLWPVGGAGVDGLAALAWLSLAALPLGVGAGAWAGRAGWAAPLAWALALSLVQSAPPTLAWALTVVAGLFAAGWGMGARWPGGAGWTAAAALAALALLGALPTLVGLAGDAPWSPGVAARLLDLSPLSLVLESAGVDWMRHPAVYGPAGADALGPDLRLPWRGALAGPTALVVGCAVARAGRRPRDARPPE